MARGRAGVSSALKTMVGVERAGLGEVMGGYSDSMYLPTIKQCMEHV